MAEYRVFRNWKLARDLTFI